MRIIGSAELRTIELPDQLQFTSGYESGWVDFMAPPAALFIVFLGAMIFHYYLVAWFVVIGYLLLVLWWLNSSVTRLIVTDTVLVARGNLGRSYSNERRVKTEELKSLAWFGGAQSEVPGLYANHGWQRTCLIPRLTAEEARAIIDTIHKKFPYLEHGKLAEMDKIHAEANGEFHPHVQILEVDPIEDLRLWKAQKIQELEMENLKTYLKHVTTEDLEPKAQDLESK